MSVKIDYTIAKYLLVDKGILVRKAKFKNAKKRAKMAKQSRKKNRGK